MAPRALTPANQITLLRLIFVPLFAIMEVEGKYAWALAILVAAAVSDALDGKVARWFHQETELGVALDPLADKALAATAFLILAFRAALPWWLTILVLSRDVAIVVTALLISLVAGYRPFRPSTLGKISTFFQVATIFVAVGSQVRTSAVGSRLLGACIYLTLAFTLVSGVHYLIVVRNRYAHHTEEASGGSQKKMA